MSEDPSVKLEIDQKAFDYVNDQVNQLADTIEEDEEAKAQVAKQEQTEEQQAVSEQDDPRNAEKWGFKALVKEGQSIVSGGLQDTASSVATFAERTKEALDGTMQREKEEQGYYTPDWDPFVNIHFLSFGVRHISPDMHRTVAYITLDYLSFYAGSNCYLFNLR